MRVAVIGAGVMGLATGWALKRRGHEAHRLDEIVHGNSLERLDVLEDLFRQKRFLL